MPGSRGAGPGSVRGTEGRGSRREPAAAAGAGSARSARRGVRCRGEGAAGCHQAAARKEGSHPSRPPSSPSPAAPRGPPPPSARAGGRGGEGRRPSPGARALAGPGLPGWPAGPQRAPADFLPSAADTRLRPAAGTDASAVGEAGGPGGAARLPPPPSLSRRGRRRRPAPGGWGVGAARSPLLRLLDSCLKVEFLPIPFPFGFSQLFSLPASSAVDFPCWKLT